MVAASETVPVAAVANVMAKGVPAVTVPPTAMVSVPPISLAAVTTSPLTSVALVPGPTAVIVAAVEEAVTEIENVPVMDAVMPLPPFAAEVTLVRVGAVAAPAVVASATGSAEAASKAPAASAFIK